MNLYIIGNGFDLAHGFKTSYYNFKEYLLDHGDKVYNYNGFSISNKDIVNKFEEVCKPRDSWMDFEVQVGKIIYKIQEDKINLFGKEWNLKLDLGEGQYRFVDVVKEQIDIPLGEIDTLFTQKEIKDKAMDYFNDNVTKNYLWIPSLYTSFQDWIKTVDISKGSPYFKIDKDSSAISFNYTKTLQEIYSITDILFIHGSTNALDDIVLGYHSISIDEDLPGLHTTYTEEHRKSQEASSQAGFKKPSSNKFYNDNINRFYKPVNVLKDKIKPFIQEKSIDTVTIIGHSYSEIDGPYFKEVVKMLPKAHYVFTYYNSEDNIKVKEMLRRLELDLDYEEVYSENLKIKE